MEKPSRCKNGLNSKSLLYFAYPCLQDSSWVYHQSKVGKLREAVDQHLLQISQALFSFHLYDPLQYCTRKANPTKSQANKTQNYKSGNPSVTKICRFYWNIDYDLFLFEWRHIPQDGSARNFDRNEIHGQTHKCNSEFIWQQEFDIFPITELELELDICLQILSRWWGNLRSTTWSQG